MSAVEMPLLLHAQARSSIHEKIPEDSPYRHFLGIIPVVGMISNFLQERSLLKKIEASNEISSITKLIEVKNMYVLSSMHQNAIQIVVAALLMASEDVNMKVPGGLICAISSAGYLVHALNFYRNKKIAQIVDVEDIKSKLGI